MTLAPKDKLWGGRFDRPPNEVFYAFQRSFAFDRRLLPYQLAVDRAWARALEGVGILTAAEVKQILAALDRIAARAKSDAAWLDRSAAEDVHHFAETALVEEAGPLGHKLCTGRSRNELVVTEFRMFIKDAAANMRRAVAALIAAIIEQAEKSLDVPMPGMTHMQHAQPILFSHFLLAHAEGFFHDLDRIAFAANTVDACPLGSGALAGCAFAVDRAALAHELGFARITRNSLDAVSRRDFVLDYLYALSVLASHLSRMAEDFVLFATPEFGFIKLSDEYLTGSSLMPQKKNPDVWELTRGKAGRIYGALLAVLTTVKGLPTSYQRDLQEDKEPLFDAHDQMLATTWVAAGAVAATQVNDARLREAAADAALVVTDVADYLVRRGVPFRQAHEIVGKVVREAERRGQPWNALPLETLKSFSPHLDAGLLKAVTLEASLAVRSLPGGTAPAAVRAAIADCRKRLEGTGVAR